MSMKRDRVNNEMVIPFYHDEAMASGTSYNSTAYDSMLELKITPKKKK